jgi:hypothetical protein
MSISKNGPSFLSQFWGRKHRYFQMPPSDAATLPELLVASTRLSSWPLASLAIGLGLYLLFLGIVILNAGWNWLMADGNWRHHYLQAPVLITYLLLIRPLARHLLSTTIETLYPLLSISDPPEALVAEAHSLSRRQEWLAFAVGAAAGWLIIRPWQSNPLGAGFLVYHLFVDGLMFGLLGWTIYSGLVMTRFLATLQRRIQNLQLLGPGTVAPLTRWSLGSAWRSPLCSCAVA